MLNPDTKNTDPHKYKIYAAYDLQGPLFTMLMRSAIITGQDTLWSMN